MATDVNQSVRLVLSSIQRATAQMAQMKQYKAALEQKERYMQAQMKNYDSLAYAREQRLTYQEQNLQLKEENQRMRAQEAGMSMLLKNETYRKAQRGNVELRARRNVQSRNAGTYDDFNYASLADATKALDSGRRLKTSITSRQGGDQMLQQAMQLILNPNRAAGDAGLEQIGVNRIDAESIANLGRLDEFVRRWSAEDRVLWGEYVNDANIAAIAQSVADTQAADGKSGEAAAQPAQPAKPATVDTVEPPTEVPGASRIKQLMTKEQIEAAAAGDSTALERFRDEIRSGGRASSVEILQALQDAQVSDETKVLFKRRLLGE